MAVTASVRKILEVKTRVSATLTKISNILDIHSGWLVEHDEEIESLSLKVKFKGEDASTMLEAIVEFCQQMINNPPPYSEHENDERYHRVLELDVLLTLGFSCVDCFHSAITDLLKVCTDRPESRMKEAMERALDAMDDVEKAQDVISQFVHHDDEEEEGEDEEDGERDESTL